MTEELRPRQKEMLRLIGEAEGSVATTDLQKWMGYRCDGPVRWHLNVLNQAGLLKPRPKFSPRTIMLSEEGKAALTAMKAA
jgi:hypothetical protein